MAFDAKFLSLQSFRVFLEIRYPQGPKFNWDALIEEMNPDHTVDGLEIVKGFYRLMSTCGCVPCDQLRYPYITKATYQANVVLITLILPQDLFDSLNK